MAVPAVGCWPNANAANSSRPRAFFFSFPGYFFGRAPYQAPCDPMRPHASCDPMRPHAAPCGPMRPHASGFSAGAPGSSCPTNCRACLVPATKHPGCSLVSIAHKGRPAAARSHRPNAVVLVRFKGNNTHRPSFFFCMCWHGTSKQHFRSQNFTPRSWWSCSATASGSRATHGGTFHPHP
jgi:hypothetical protein